MGFLPRGVPSRVRHAEFAAALESGKVSAGDGERVVLCDALKLRHVCDAVLPQRAQASGAHGRAHSFDCEYHRFGGRWAVLSVVSTQVLSVAPSA